MIVWNKNSVGHRIDFLSYVRLKKVGSENTKYIMRAL